MAQIEGTLNNNAKIIVLDSSNETILAGQKTSGSFLVDGFGEVINPTTESGTIIAVSSIGETLAYNKIEFIQSSDLPQTYPWTETFTGADTTAPTGHLWTRNFEAPYAGILNNALRTTSSGATYSYPIVSGDFLLWGNFDIQIDLNIVSGPTSDNWTATLGLRLEPAMGSDNIFQVRREYTTAGGHGFACYWIENGTGTKSAVVASSLTNTKLRLRRINNNFYGYYWTGSAWTQIGSAVDLSGSTVGGHGPVSTRFGANTANNRPTVICDWDNFIINYGYVSYRYAENFVGYSDGPPDSDYYTITLGTPTITSNRLQLIGNASHSQERVQFNYKLVGNFDIFTRFNLSAAPSTNNWSFTFEARHDSDNKFYIGRRYSSAQQYIASSEIGGSVSSATAASSVTTGYLRLKRSGTDITCYYLNASNVWTVLHTRPGFTTNDVYIFFQMAKSNTLTASGEFYEFKIINKYFNDQKVYFPTMTFI